MLKEIVSQLAGMNTELAFVEWLESQLTSRGWKRSELARRANVTPTAISDVLNGRRSPGPELCNAIASGLKLPPEFVFRRAGLLPPAKEETEMGEVNRAMFGRLSKENQLRALEYMEFLKISEEKGEYRVDETRSTTKQASSESG